MSFLIAAFTLGIASSAHCLVMCGPISLALYQDNNRRQTMRTFPLYHLGRVLTYMMLGLLFAYFGTRLYIFNYQQQFSIVFGVLLITYAISPRVFKRMRLSGWWAKKIYPIWTTLASGLFMKKDPRSRFLLGMMNGLLPCGIVYVALAGALGTATFVQGAWYMLAFGIGTFPVFTALIFSRQWAQLLSGRTFKQLIPVVMSAVGILLIVRGANLDLGHFSPNMMANQIFIAVCE